MSDINQPPPGGQGSVHPLSDPAVAQAWIVGLREHVAEAKAAIDDQMLPPRQRRLGHVAAARILEDAFTAIDKAILFGTAPAS